MLDNTNIGGINSTSDGGVSGEVNDPNKIKINLNLTDELRDQLFGLDGDVPVTGQELVKEIIHQEQEIITIAAHHQEIEAVVEVKMVHAQLKYPRDSITSLCRGCDVDRL